jgi:hypothetical protein
MLVCNLYPLTLYERDRVAASPRVPTSRPKPRARAAFAAHARARFPAPAPKRSNAMLSTSSIVAFARASFARASSSLQTVAVPQTSRGFAAASTRRSAASAPDDRASAPVDRYGAGRGPMAGLLRVLRDEGAMTARALFERATALGVGTRSMRHMKGLLNKMKAIDRVATHAPGEGVGDAGGGKRRGRGNFTFSVTEAGRAHADKLDRSIRPPG